MKLRTEFVTNSSSYSSAEIKIDNPVLLEILKRYEALGAFETDGVYSRASSIGSSERAQKRQYLDSRSLAKESERELAFCYYENEDAHVFFAPKSIEEVIDAIFTVIADGDVQFFKNQKLFNECKKECEDRMEEINNAYSEVYWSASDDDHDIDFDEESEWFFNHYGPSRPGSLVIQDVELFNVNHVERRIDGAIRPLRFPGTLLSSFGDKTHFYPLTVGRMSTGCEIRFVGEAADITVSSEDVDGTVEIYRGDFFVRVEKLTAGVPKCLCLRSELQLDTTKNLPGGRFSPNVWRIVFDHDYRALIHGITPIKPIRPPHPDEVPKKCILAYGSSITHSAGAGIYTNSYIYNVGRMLGADVLCKGMGGSCFCEEDVTEFIEREAWDMAILELGVNMVTEYPVELFKQRVRYMLTCLLELDRPIFLISNFTCHFNYSDGPVGKKNAEYIAALEELYEQFKCKNLHYIKGTDVITDMTFLTADVLHPSPFGHMQMARIIADKIRDELGG